MSGPQRSLWLVMAALFVGLLPVAVHSQNPPESKAQSGQLTLNDVVIRMEAARQKNKQTPPFLLTREYQMFHGEESTPDSQVKAQINVVPPSERDYKIIESRGSDRGESIVRKILEHEAAEEKNARAPAAIIRDNYEFSDRGRQWFEGINCYVLGLKPRRQEATLIEGQAWVDPDTFAVRRIEGKLAKSPSWWVKDVNVVVNFGPMNGIWTQTSTQAVADVRVLGKYSVTGRVLDVQTSDALAMNAAKKPLGRHSGVPATFLYGTRR